MKKNYERTIHACFIGFITQAIVNNFAPLLFLTFETSFKIPLSKITTLITLNFIIQLLVDLLSTKFVDKLGYRKSIYIAHIFSVLGLISLAFLPYLLPSSYIGLVISVALYALGGGLLEVLVSPIMESSPTENKEKAMSLLHSFYSWGYVAVVLISTIYFKIFGIKNWRILACIWALVPFFNLFLFMGAPINSIVPEGKKEMSVKELFKNKTFWILFILMVASGASEQAVSQWASTFSEKALGLSKALGDLTGPMAFAILMGSARAFYGKFGDKIPLRRFMTLSGILCLISYLLISLSPSPVLSLVGCALCGLSIGIMWPGSLSISSSSLPRGGTALFALLALGGDLGCTLGPTLTGFVSSSFSGDLKKGILCSIIFPLLVLLSLLLLKKKKEILTYDKEKEIPIMKCSICNGESVIGFRNKETGKFHEIMAIKTEEDMLSFLSSYGLKESDIKREF